MSLEILEQLEAKVQTAVDTITLLQMELEELKEQNQQLISEAESLKGERTGLEEKASKMEAEHNAWQERIRTLLGKMEDVE
ncbi:septal ring assembly protein ZapB [Vibrio sp. HA2012]|uniref:cell division protein ZapB n=1 Tax=Vibrio sp. HA2012 TaxID=1971595 RepID=UPI000C2BF299|nr:cell division protein ZapB [Vibrio sp. HA2012]PJC85650.1 septal ring assembly protein ZapB [Vibrio sp. HA2012]